MGTKQVNIDAFDALYVRLSTLHACLAVIDDQGYANFVDMSEAIQKDYLHGCVQLARQCTELISSLVQGGKGYEGGAA